MSEYIEVGQPLQFTDPNTPTRVGEIVENVSDIYNIPSPRLGMQVFVKSEKKSFVITSLKSKVIGGVNVPEAAVEAFEAVAHGGDVTAIYNAIQQNTVNITNEIQRAKVAENILTQRIVNETVRATEAENEIKKNAVLFRHIGITEHADKLELGAGTIDGDEVNYIEIPAATTEKAGVMSANDKVKLNASIKNIDVSPGTEDVELDLEDNTDKTNHVVFPAATPESAGVMSAEDKIALDTATSRALRALFVAAGAEYNDTDQIIQKTAPWGETVQHLPKHYYLNGLGDITEEQMIDIYNAGIFKGTANYYAGYNDIRTFLPAKISGQEGCGAFQIKGLVADCKNIEVVRFSSERNLVAQYGIAIDPKNIASAFNNCKNLKYIQDINFGAANVSVSSAFYNCFKLEYIKIRKLAINISFSNSSIIKKESVIFIIQNAAPTSAITITLHPDAYARIANQPDILEALEAQPLITLVSA